MEDMLAQAQAERAARPVHEFELPPEVQALGDKYVKKSIGLIKLDMREELFALERAGNSAGKAAFYSIIAALVEVDGRRVDKTSAEDERIVTHTDPIIRSLMADAYTELSGVSKETAKKFLGSRRVKVG